LCKAPSEPAVRSVVGASSRRRRSGSDQGHSG
jgi:hypothetical protein